MREECYTTLRGTRVHEEGRGRGGDRARTTRSGRSWWEERGRVVMGGQKGPGGWRRGVGFFKVNSNPLRSTLLPHRLPSPIASPPFPPHSPTTTIFMRVPAPDAQGLSSRPVRAPNRSVARDGLPYMSYSSRSEPHLFHVHISSFFRVQSCHISPRRELYLSIHFFNSPAAFPCHVQSHMIVTRAIVSLQLYVRT